MSSNTKRITSQHSDTETIIATLYGARNFSEHIPTKLEVKSKHWVEKIEEQSKVDIMRDNLEYLCHYMQLSYYATEYQPELHKMIKKICLDVSEMCSQMFTSLNECICADYQYKVQRFCDLDHDEQWEKLEQFAKITKKINASVNANKCKLLIAKLNIDLTKHKPKHDFTNHYQTANIEITETPYRNAHMQLNSKVIASNLDFYLENTEKIVQHQKQLLELQQNEHQKEIAQKQFYCKQNKRRSSMHEQEIQRERLSRSAKKNDQEHKRRSMHLSLELETTLTNNSNDYDQQLRKNRIMCSSELEADKRNYNKAIKDIEKDYQESTEEPNQQYCKKKKQLDELMYERLDHNQAEFEKKLELSKVSLEQQLLATRWSVFNRKSKRTSAYNEKAAADDAYQKEKDKADMEVMEENEKQTKIALGQKEECIKSITQQCDIRKSLTTAEYEKAENYTKIKKDEADKKAEQEKLEADKKAKEKIKKEEMAAKHAKYLAYIQLQEVCPTASADIDEVMEQIRLDYKSKEENNRSNLKDFELQVLFQAVCFQRSYKKSQALLSDETYRQTITYCFNQTVTALSYIMETIKRVEFFWTEIERICTGTHLLSSKVAKQVDDLQSLKSGKCSNKTHIANLERRQQNTKFRADMVDQHDKYSSVFDLCTKARDTFAFIQVDVTKFIENIK